MEYTVEKINEKELTYLINLLETNKTRFLKLIGYVTLIVCFPLFTPISILKFLRRGSRNMAHDSEFLFIELGPQNVFFFIVIPVLIFFILCYFFIFHFPKIRKDINTREKLIAIVKVREIKELDEDTKKTLMGLSDYKTVFEKNDFGLNEIMFSSKKNPESMDVKAYKVEVSRYAKVNLKREIVTEL
ncbi:hypothetical protein [Chryseobacterium sp. JK1]|uniref:hypothetical protein n=1 Tax=Chryseobacterium sp. JK1 TaxID=874294 RepID=UPI003D684C8E